MVSGRMVGEVSLLSPSWLSLLVLHAGGGTQKAPNCQGYNAGYTSQSVYLQESNYKCSCLGGKESRWKKYFDQIW